MPLHDYVCRDCGQHFEALVRSGATAVCPHCGGTSLDKQISAPAPPGRSKAIVAAARRQAAREGHMSNFSAAERTKLLKT